MSQVVPVLIYAVGILTFSLIVLRSKPVQQFDEQRGESPNVIPTPRSHQSYHDPS
ncbi:hypothetical protein [Bacillus fonticola]|uniref:hypothetical protein n=1 Tax=Bacillus fonticola TaxID=2728853 RepID=UPI001474E6EA|nr:hypothetical protein [Bacillus fonticola]